MKQDRNKHGRLTLRIALQEGRLLKKELTQIIYIYDI